MCTLHTQPSARRTPLIFNSEQSKWLLLEDFKVIHRTQHRKPQKLTRQRKINSDISNMKRGTNYLQLVGTARTLREKVNHTMCLCYDKIKISVFLVWAKHSFPFLEEWEREVPKLKASGGVLETCEMVSRLHLQFHRQAEMQILWNTIEEFTQEEFRMNPGSHTLHPRLKSWINKKWWSIATYTIMKEKNARKYKNYSISPVLCQESGGAYWL